MLEYIIPYLIVSQMLMFVFLLLNEESIRNSYLSFESRRGDKPSTKWFILYIISHILKAPLLAPMILILILFNNGKLVE
tara:strand:+ start:1414 stop:1650 length:237 start_codon:yes stop_codon:yes gene_type:complete